MSIFPAPLPVAGPFKGVRAAFFDRNCLACSRRPASLSRIAALSVGGRVGVTSNKPCCTCGLRGTSYHAGAEHAGALVRSLMARMRQTSKSM